MVVPWIVIVCRGAVLCLVPLGFYFQTLARRHRTPRVTVTSGVVDFLMLLAGLGGFLLAGLALVLGAVAVDPRLVGPAEFARIEQVFARQHLYWLATGLGYFALVGLLAYSSLKARRRALTVTRIDREAVERAIDEALAACGLPATRFGRVWSADGPVVGLNYVEAWRYADVTVLATDPRLAEEVHRQLTESLARATPSRHDASAAFSASSWVAFFAAAVAFGLLVVYEFARRG